MRKYTAEFLGTFALVFCGTGAIVVNEQFNGAVTHVGMAVTVGLIVMSMIYSLGNISGAHFNPAVTVAFAISKKFPFKEVIPYCISQVAGALFASLMLKILFPENLLLGTTLPSGSVSQSLILEFILTFILMFTIVNVSQGAKEQGIMAGIAIGSVILLEAMFAGPVSGASMNPARSIAPAIVSGHLHHLWIYIAAPFTGAVVGSVAANYLRKER